jgi:hypothetical protein
MYHWYIMTMPISHKKTDGGRIPGPAAVPNVIEIACTVILPNQKTSRMTFHGAYATTPPAMATLAGALWTSLSTAWGSNLGALMATSTSFTNVFVRDMTNVTNPVFQGTGTAVAGTGAGAAMPVNNALVMTENVNQRGRGSKGRVYLGGWIVTADAGAGLATAAAQTAINNFGTAVANAINAQTLTPCVAQPARQQYQGVTGTVHPARGASHVAVTSYVCRDLIWDTQRRRIQP